MIGATVFKDMEPDDELYDKLLKVRNESAEKHVSTLMRAVVRCAALLHRHKCYSHIRFEYMNLNRFLPKTVGSNLS